MPMAREPAPTAVSTVDEESLFSLEAGCELASLEVEPEIGPQPSTADATETSLQEPEREVRHRLFT